MPAGATQNVTVTFSPDNAKSYSGNLLVNSDASSGNGKMFTSGTGFEQTRIIGLSGNLSFGQVFVNQVTSKILTIKNNGTGNLNVTGITFPAGFSGNWSGVVPAGSSQNVTVTFTPSLAQTYVGNLTVASDASSGAGFLAVSGGGFEPVMIPVEGGVLPISSELAGTAVATFKIGRYEVTWGEWQEVRTWAVANGYSDLENVGIGTAESNPVEQVSWYDVVKWCNAKSQKEGLTPVYQLGAAVYKTGEPQPTINTAANGYSQPTVNTAANGYRLPKEAEWEWAARGGINSQGYIYSGSNDLNAVAWYATFNYNSDSKPVGTKDKNELGIYDMSGNLKEWCEEKGGASSLRRVRGGGWFASADWCRVDLGDQYSIDVRLFNIGFRLAQNMQ